MSNYLRMLFVVLQVNSQNYFAVVLTVLSRHHPASVTKVYCVSHMVKSPGEVVSLTLILLASLSFKIQVRILKY